MPRVADQLIETLKSEIYKGVLKPGDQLEETSLADRFGVSRTPIREAVRSLVDLGLLETRSRKGAFVRVATAKELIDLFEVAAELEALACRLSAERLTDDTSLEIQNSLQECEEAAKVGDISSYAVGNLRFHAAIRDASGNLWLKSELSEIEVRINPYRSMPYKMHNRLAKSIQEHREIQNAILDANADKAANLMRDHIMLQGQRLPLLLRTTS
tara:strand:- start:207 stop:848 length:642 start_codon:yes stop_codon:yes gene_type:complete